MKGFTQRRKKVLLFHRASDVSFNEMCAEIWNLHSVKGHGVIGSVKK